VRRIGKVVREQIGLYGTLTGTGPAPAPPVASEASASRIDSDLADVLELPVRRRGEGERSAGREDR
jgi:hypothetical protein